MAAAEGRAERGNAECCDGDDGEETDKDVDDATEDDDGGGSDEMERNVENQISRQKHGAREWADDRRERASLLR